MLRGGGGGGAGCCCGEPSLQSRQHLEQKQGPEREPRLPSSSAASKHPRRKMLLSAKGSTTGGPAWDRLLRVDLSSVCVDSHSRGGPRTRPRALPKSGVDMLDEPPNPAAMPQPKGGQTGRREGRKEREKERRERKGPSLHTEPAWGHHISINF